MTTTIEEELAEYLASGLYHPAVPDAFILQTMLQILTLPNSYRFNLLSSEEQNYIANLVKRRRAEALCSYIPYLRQVALEIE